MRCKDFSVRAHKALTGRQENHRVTFNLLLRKLKPTSPIFLGNTTTFHTMMDERSLPIYPTKTVLKNSRPTGYERKHKWKHSSL